MYTEYFGLPESPFAITPDARYLYLSAHHREALAHLHYGMSEGGGFVQLTGDVGTGKTTVCRALLEQLPPHVDAALVLNPALTAQGLLQTVCEELLIDVPPDCGSTKTLINKLNSYLLDANARGRRTVLIIDEAQNLSREVLEQVRLLTNLETNKSKLLQIFLIGQPELRTLLSDKGLRQVAQRVTARYHLSALNAFETEEYIRHRLSVAGCPRPLFTRAAVRRVYRYSKGVPRITNILCDRALLGAYATDQQRVSPAIVNRAYRELSGRTRPRGSAWARALLAVTGAAAAGVVIAWGLGGVPQEPLQNHETPQAAEAPRGDIAGHPQLAGPVDAAEVESRGAPSLDESTEDTQPESPATSDPQTQVHPTSAEDRLIAAWGIPQRNGIDISLCDWATLHGLSCLGGRGDWPTLRKLNRPAIVSVSISTGGQNRYTALAVVTAITEDTVTLGIGGREFELPLADTGLDWFGDYLVLWKPPLPDMGILRQGAFGPKVVWLRQALNSIHIDGSMPVSSNATAFDEALEARIKAFQRSQAILEDGVVGRETLIHLNTALSDPAVPRIWTPPAT